MSPSRCLILAMIIGATACIGGCTTTITPPANPPDPVPAYLTDYGRHSSLLLRDPHGHLSEFAFGDWNWFALGHKSSSDVFGSLFFSSASALGKRQLDLPDDLARIKSAAGAEKVWRLDVSHTKSNALIEQLDALHERYRDTMTFSPRSQLWFVKYDGHYGLFHNCNHVSANWLKEFGCTVSGPAMTSRFVVRNGAESTNAAPK